MRHAAKWSWAVVCCSLLPGWAAAQERTVADLMRGLQDPCAAIRAESAAGLGFVQGASAEAAVALARVLTDSDPQVRYEAALSLERMGEAAAPALPILAEALGDGCASVRARAASALGAIGKVEPNAVPLLRSLLRSEVDDGVGGQVVAALRRIGPEACVAAARELVLAEENLVPGALDAVKDAGAAAVPALLERLEADDCRSRIHVVHALSCADPNPALVEPVLQRMLAGDHSGKRVAAADLGWRLSPAMGADRVIRVLVAELERSLSSDYFPASCVLGLIGPEARPAVPALIAALERTACDPRLRNGAIEALGRIGAGAVEAVPVLERIAAQEPDLREAATSAIQSIRREGD